MLATNIEKEVSQSLKRKRGMGGLEQMNVLKYMERAMEVEKQSFIVGESLSKKAAIETFR